MINFALATLIFGSVTSQSLMDAGMILIFILFLVDFFKKRVSLSDFQKIGIEWALIGYFFVAMLSLSLNGKQPVPWLFYIAKFTWIPNLYLGIYAFNRTEINYRKWMKFFNWAFLIPNFYAIFTYFKGFDYITQKPIVGVIGLLDSATYHAHGNSLIFIFFSAIFVFCYKSLSKTEKIFSIFSLSLMGISIFLSLTRGIWGALFITLFLLSLLRNKKFSFLFVMGTLLTLILLVSLNPLIQERLFQSFTSHSDQVRSQLLQVHWVMFKEHPWFGIGFWESYRQIADYWPKIGLPPDYFETHAHNQYLSVLATTGIIGFLFFISFYGYFFQQAVRFYKKTQNNPLFNTVSIACLLLVIQFALACLTDVSFEYAKIRELIVLGFSALVSLKQRQVNSHG